jgi:hypothetical protein
VPFSFEEEEAALPREMTDAREDWRCGIGAGAGVEVGVEDREDGPGAGGREDPVVARESWPGGTCHVALYEGNDKNEKLENNKRGFIADHDFTKSACAELSVDLIMSLLVEAGWLWEELLLQCQVPHHLWLGGVGTWWWDDRWARARN